MAVIKNNATTEKAKQVKQYEKNCPQSFRAYVEQTLNYPSTANWDYDMLADEFGHGYMTYWNVQLQQINNSLEMEARS